jgi:hypothetical protein
MTMVKALHYILLALTFVTACSNLLCLFGEHLKKVPTALRSDSRDCMDGTVQLPSQLED